MDASAVAQTMTFAHEPRIHQAEGGRIRPVADYRWSTTLCHEHSGMAATTRHAFSMILQQFFLDRMLHMGSLLTTV